MNAKKKNAEHVVHSTCKVCNTERTLFRLIGKGKSRIVYECKCGITDKRGVKI